MGWMPSRRYTSLGSKATQDAILSSLHRGLLLASASRRLQDSISAQRARAEAHLLLNTVTQMCAEGSDVDATDERIRKGLAALKQALEA
jgi:hypothetical protein